MSDFILGVDLGQAQDPTALAAVEADPSQIDLRHLEQFPLGTPYPAVVERVGKVSAALPWRPYLVVDAGGPGRPVVDMMRVAGLKPIPVSITSGRRARCADGMVYVPKRELVRVVVVALETGRLRIAKRLPLAGAFKRELESFKVTITAKARATYAAKAGEHDDLVMAVALAVWFGNLAQGHPSFTA